GLVPGLSVAFLPMAAGIVLSTFVVVNRELEAARTSSERIVTDLRAAQDELREYAAQVDELVAIEERSRLARGLQESVSATLASALEAGASAREQLGDHAAAAQAIERLQTLTQQALAQMRAIIEELRPAAAQGDAAGADTVSAVTAPGTAGARRAD
ncbi:MAG TPA: histidine kinase, partial [Thermoleophilia bacterium]|nr:histidine kinase [Thermoleophilia bacterium]